MFSVDKDVEIVLNDAAGMVSVFYNQDTFDSITGSFAEILQHYFR